MVRMASRCRLAALEVALRIKHSMAGTKVKRKFDAQLLAINEVPSRFPFPRHWDKEVSIPSAGLMQGTTGTSKIGGC